VTQGVFECLHEYSHNGFERVLAVALQATALAGGVTWQLLQAGASDVFAWERVPAPAAMIAARFERWDEVDRLVRSPLVQNNLVGQSRAWVSVLRQVVEVARFTDSSALIMGESGTGKELIARLIHTLDARPNKRQLVVLDCTTVVPELSGSEFFGHERGAFTNAVSDRDGAFALADKGTLFLDEVGELPITLQAELLRVIQEGTYKRLGSNTWKQTDFRLVCATNRDLIQEVEGGRFRHDLYYRITSWTVKLPPLRERREDIPYLVRYFLQELRPDDEPPELDDAVRDYLLTQAYPGNVRELRQLVRRIANRHVGHGPITAGAIPEAERPAADFVQADWQDEAFACAIRRALSVGVGLKEITNAAAEAAVSIAMDDEGGNLQRAALKLGVTDRALQMRQAARRQREQGDTSTG
jgi:transcriptional regulator with GAF, ATPase, and Fis domain